MEMGRRSSRVVRTSALLLGDKIGNNVGGWPPFGFFLPIFEPWGPVPSTPKGRVAMLPLPFCFMPRGLHRSYGADHLHFIACSC